MEKVLVTGGAGYVGSHTVIELLNNNYDVHVVDNMCNAVMGPSGQPASLEKVGKICGKNASFTRLDLRNEADIENFFDKSGPFQCVIHFAALKAVGESCKQPLQYYENNVSGTINLLKIMARKGCSKIVFSSSATVYGAPEYLPVDESHPVGRCTNPYGKTKFVIEEMINDLCSADQNFKGIMLRYFNPVGAHASGEIGEDPKGIPNNLMPYIAQVAIGKLSQLNIFGNDYNTIDGTGVRDYIHVMDLAVGHVAAVNKICSPNFTGWQAYNLGTGKGASVLQVIEAFKNASGKEIPFVIVPRRPGDVASTYADCSKALKELNFTASKTLYDMCADSWNWQQKNPQGFQN